MLCLLEAYKEKLKIFDDNSIKSLSDRDGIINVINNTFDYFFF